MNENYLMNSKRRREHVMKVVRVGLLGLVAGAMIFVAFTRRHQPVEVAPAPPVVQVPVEAPKPRVVVKRHYEPERPVHHPHHRKAVYRVCYENGVCYVQRCGHNGLCVWSWL